MTREEAHAKIVAEILADDNIHPGETLTVYRSRMREAGWVKSDRFDYRFNGWRPFTGVCPLLKGEYVIKRRIGSHTFYAAAPHGWAKDEEKQMVFSSFAAAVEYQEEIAGGSKATVVKKGE